VFTQHKGLELLPIGIYTDYGCERGLYFSTDPLETLRAAAAAAVAAVWADLGCVALAGRIGRAAGSKASLFRAALPILSEAGCRFGGRTSNLTDALRYAFDRIDDFMEAAPALLTSAAAGLSSDAA